jgi:hypothetical protein
MDHYENLKIIIPNWHFTHQSVNISMFFDQFAYNRLFVSQGHYRHFQSNSQFTVATTKQLSENPQFSSHSSFSTVHNSQQLFQNPQLNQTHP